MLVHITTTNHGESKTFMANLTDRPYVYLAQVIAKGYTRWVIEFVSEEGAKESEAALENQRTQNEWFQTNQDVLEYLAHSTAPRNFVGYLQQVANPGEALERHIVESKRTP